MWIGVDFDGTLATHCKGGLYPLGDPIPDMMERVKGWLAAETEVRIVTARGADTKHREAVEEWLVEHGLPKLVVTDKKDFDMVQLWDDRAVQVITDTGQPLLDSILKFNKGMVGPTT